MREHRGGKQNFRGGYGRHEWNRHKMYSRGFNQFGQRGNQDFMSGRRSGFRDGIHFEKFRSEMKGLKEQIWKEGIMDLKEKEMLHDKMKSFRNNRFQRQHDNSIRRENDQNDKLKDH